MGVGWEVSWTIGYEFVGPVGCTWVAMRDGDWVEVRVGWELSWILGYEFVVRVGCTLYLSGCEIWRRRLWCCSVSRLRGQTRWSLRLRGLSAMQSFAILMNVSFVFWLSPISWYYSGKPMQSFAILMTFCFWLWFFCSVTSLSCYFNSWRICVWVLSLSCLRLRCSFWKFSVCIVYIIMHFQVKTVKSKVT